MRSLSQNGFVYLINIAINFIAIMEVSIYNKIILFLFVWNIHNFINGIFWWWRWTSWIKGMLCFSINWVLLTILWSIRRWCNEKIQSIISSLESWFLGCCLRESWSVWIDIKYSWGPLWISATLTFLITAVANIN
jgi:hypothetical protein